MIDSNILKLHNLYIDKVFRLGAFLMSRYFMIQSWVGSHENEPDYNGQQAGERNVRSSEVVPLYDKNGRANTQYFSDEAIAERMGKTVKKKSSISIEDKILPQAARLRRLTEQLIELEQAKKDGMDIDKYSKLRDVLIVKRNRCEVLLQKTLNVKPEPTPSDDEDSTDYDEQYAEYSGENAAQNVMHGVDVPVWLQGVSPTNSLKKPLIKACQTYKTLVRWAIKTKHYINELKAV